MLACRCYARRGSGGYAASARRSPRGRPARDRRASRRARSSGPVSAARARRRRPASCGALPSSCAAVSTRAIGGAADAGLRARGEQRLRSRSRAAARRRRAAPRRSRSSRGARRARGAAAPVSQSLPHAITPWLPRITASTSSHHGASAARAASPGCAYGSFGISRAERDQRLGDERPLDRVAARLDAIAVAYGGCAWTTAPTSGRRS